MTITLETTDLCKEVAPGIVHIDGTARPQFVDESTNQPLFQILRHYFEITQLPMLINTSFNMHEKPIVFSARHAYEDFKESGLDALTINSFILQ